MGGLISRMYINDFMPMAVDGRPVARRLAMLGTPNMGSPCAYWINTILLGVPTQQLRPDYIEGFNRRVVNRKGVVFSILAGDVNLRTCGSSTTGDTVVEVPSAHWILGDRVTTHVLHTAM